MHTNFRTYLCLMVLAVLLLKLNKTFFLMSKNSFLQREKRSSKHIFPFSYYPVKNWHIYLTLVVCTFTLPWTWSECTANVDYYYQGDIHYPHYIYPCNLPKFQCFLSVSHSILTLMWSQLYNLNIHMLQDQIILMNNNQPWSVDGVSVVVEPSKCFWK